MGEEGGGGGGAESRVGRRDGREGELEGEDRGILWKFLKGEGTVQSFLSCVAKITNLINDKVGGEDLLVVFLSQLANTELNHWTKWVARTKFIA